MSQNNQSLKLKEKNLIGVCLENLSLEKLKNRDICIDQIFHLTYNTISDTEAKLRKKEYLYKKLKYPTADTDKELTSLIKYAIYKKEEEERIKERGEPREPKFEDIISYLSSHYVDDLPSIQDLTYHLEREFDDMWMDFFYDVRGDGFDFISEDGIRCKLVSEEYKCIQHSRFEVEGGDFTYIIKNGDKESFICADCLIHLQLRPDITDQYMYSSKYKDIPCLDHHGVELDRILFPANWNDAGIHAWCRKKQEREEQKIEEEQKRELEKYELEQEEYEEEEEVSNCCVCNNYDSDEDVCKLNIILEEDQEVEECERFDFYLER